MRFGKLAFLFMCVCILSIFFQVVAFAAAPPQLKVKSAVLMEENSGKLIYAKNADKPIPPASLTKILTLYIVNEELKLGRIHPSDKVKISRKAQLTCGSSMYLVEEREVTLDDLIKGIAVVSANDAAVAVAEHIGGTEQRFVDLMNKKARQLGMKNSHFKNPSGLPAKGQVTTARDMAKLARAYIEAFPEALQIHSMQSFTYDDITQQNGNTLLKKSPDVDGLKTGFVRSAGFHLIATAKKDEKRLIAVAMGAKNPAMRARETERLLEVGFKKSLSK